MLAHTCNPSSQVAEPRESGVQGQLGLHKSPRLKIKTKETEQQQTVCPFHPTVHYRKKPCETASLQQSSVLLPVHGPANRIGESGLS